MKLQVNGSQVVVPPSVKTIADLIEHFDLKSPVIIAEHNEMILEKDDHKTRKLKAGDKVEFVQFVGGG